MAELPNRMDLEADFNRRLSRLSARHRRELRELLGTPPDPRNVPDEFWRRVEDERNAEMLLLLLLITQESQRLHVGELLPDALQDLPADTLASVARDWSGQRAASVAAGNVAKARERLAVRADYWRNFGGAVPSEQLEGDLVDVFGPRMDAATAATETTSAQTAGANGAIGAAEAFGYRVATRWYTRKDDRVCPVCAPLHGKHVDLWELVLRNVVAPGGTRAIESIALNGGPPAHPSCRCYVTTTVEAPARRVRTGAMAESVAVPEAYKAGWKKVGGSSVHVNSDGRIDKGCPGLKGEYVSDLIDEPQESRDRREARQAKAEAKGLTGRDVNMQQAKRLEGDKATAESHETVRKVAKQYGVTPEEVYSHIPDVIEARKDADAIRIEAKRAAHRMTRLSPSDINRMENQYKDSSHAKAFDEVADELAVSHPEYGIRDGEDLWALMREPHRPKALPHHEDVIDEAAQKALQTRENKKSRERAAAVDQNPQDGSDIF